MGVRTCSIGQTNGKVVDAPSLTQLGNTAHGCCARSHMHSSRGISSSRLRARARAIALRSATRCRSTNVTCAASRGDAQSACQIGEGSAILGLGGANDVLSDALLTIEL